ncbi:tRNA ligase [Tilletia horrida]|uniref:tRNA ligase n=1 Tax=Tilletia horrida TaxID=155126 RepID=A0AAN6JTC9_9BASI|nr:tRNA ligase [Tilletia horrida]KAK0569882.1 tRNA ligase [Tilletia horrida]
MTDADLAKQVESLAINLSTASISKVGAAPARTADELVAALNKASEGGPKSKRLIRSTVHSVVKEPQGSAARRPVGETPSAREQDSQSYSLVSWKTAEFAYRKSAGLSSELPTLARGLFTEQTGDKSHRIIVRGYDKFFNVGELPWTKPAAIKKYSTPPYHLTFKENGCIIFIAALSPTQIVVTSKHSLGSRDEVEVSHAVKGEEWLVKHLARRNKSKSDLAGELWRRNETAVCELCDDSFEEHVIAYTEANSGLHLHGLNANQPTFATRPMQEVDTFAREWGFIPTRWLELNSMDEVDRLTAEISKTGSWKGEAIEGFVVRTHVPSSAASDGKEENPLPRPPYAPGQEWFYKIKFEEPYLMYRDWRELTRRLLREKKDWQTKTKVVVHPIHPPARITPELAKPPAVEQASQPEADLEADVGTDPKKSKTQSKKEKKAQAQEKHKAAAFAAQQAATTEQHSDDRPPRPELRFKRPKTVLYVEWAYDLLHGSDDGTVKPQPQFFEHFNQGKGIIALRQAFLEYLRTPDGKKRLAALGGVVDDDDRSEQAPFDKTLIVPIGVPGCGKTSLLIALRTIFQWGHTQSDDVQTKRTGPQFLGNIEQELEEHDVVLADRNNHLFKHRDEIVGLVEKIKKQSTAAASKSAPGKKGSSKSKKPQSDKPEQQAGTSPSATPPKPLRIRLIALTWAFDSHALNDVHTVCAARITLRGENHQSLRVEGATDGPKSGSKRSKLPHEQVLWSFLEELQPLGSSLGGEGDQGQADELFDHTIKLEIEYDREKALRSTISALCPILDITQPSEEEIRRGLDAAADYKVSIKKDMATRGPASGGGKTSKPRYYAINVDADFEKLIPQLIERCADEDLQNAARQALQKLQTANRLIQHPHITLVHSKSVEAEAVGKARANEGDGLGAKERWDTYQKLCKQHPAEAKKDGTHPLTFSFKVNNLVWDGRVMALGVRDVACPAVPDFARLQGGHGGFHQGKWRPHITVGTASDDIRPFEANEVLRLAEKGGKDSRAKMIDADATAIEVRGVLEGMWA